MEQHAPLSKEDEEALLRGIVCRNLKPGGEYGARCARMCQDLLKRGASLTSAGPTVQDVFRHSADVDIKKWGITLDKNTVKLLAVGITELDAAELRAAICRAPFLLIAADESVRNGDKKFPIFLSFWHDDSDEPWYGLFRVCNMRDKTGETQASLFYDTIINDLKYPPSQVLFVLSDNTASVSGEEGGCVALLQRKLRGEDTTKKATAPGKRRKKRAAGGARGDD